MSDVGLLRDLQYSGCFSGTVGHLIYYTDIAAWWTEHGREAARLVSEHADECECAIGDMLRGWDATDPLALDDVNRVLLAWAAFEETAHRIGSALDIEL